MKQTINWRQLYNESQAIQPEDTNVSIERICRLVNIYKNDLIDQDLHQYTQRLSNVARCCKTCTLKSYTTYKWHDTDICTDKNLFDFRLSGRSVYPLIYYWNKTLLEQCNDRGQPSDFTQNQDDEFSFSLLSNINENVTVRNHILTSWIPNCINRLIIKFQMYYTYRKAQSISPSIQVHNQPMKSFRFLFQTTAAPLFVCFIHENNNPNKLFWTFRHLIARFNWPLTTKIFSNRSFKNCSIFERFMAKSLGFIDLSKVDMTQNNLFLYLYRCLKTCHQNGPIIFLFDYSTVFNPTSSDYCLMSFLCDLVRFDFSIPDVIIIPADFHKYHLSFCQPYLFKELVDYFTKKFNVQGPLSETIKMRQVKNAYQCINGIFLHLLYDTNQLISNVIEFQHVITSLELCQVPVDVVPTAEVVFNVLQTILDTCPFIATDNYQWNQVNQQDIERFNLQYNKCTVKLKLISIVRKNYFPDILAGCLMKISTKQKYDFFIYSILALSILSKIQHDENTAYINEDDMLNQIAFLLFIFGNKDYLVFRPCQTLQQMSQQIIQHCQMRNYISTVYASQKSMRFRDVILSDHEWSDDNEESSDDNFLDHEDDDNDNDEIMAKDFSSKSPTRNKSFYRINFDEYQCQLKFFAKLFGSYMEAVVIALKYHIDGQDTSFTFEEFNDDEPFYFRETSHLLAQDIIILLQRACMYRSTEYIDLADKIPILFESFDENIIPLSTDELVSLHDDFVKLFNCCRN